MASQYLVPGADGGDLLNETTGGQYLLPSGALVNQTASPPPPPPPPAAYGFLLLSAL